MKEADLFDYIKTNYLPDLNKSEDPFSKWDCYSVAKNMRIELKCRATHYKELMIEQPKYIYLLKKNVLDKENCYYINSTPKGIYSFDISKIKPVWIKDERMPATTEFEKTDRVQKVYALLNIDEAKKI